MILFRIILSDRKDKKDRGERRSVEKIEGGGSALTHSGIFNNLFTELLNTIFIFKLSSKLSFHFFLEKEFFFEIFFCEKFRKFLRRQWSLVSPKRLSWIPLPCLILQFC
jgi:hypothetical protein